MDSLVLIRALGLDKGGGILIQPRNGGWGLSSIWFKDVRRSIHVKSGAPQ